MQKSLHRLQSKRKFNNSCYQSLTTHYSTIEPHQSYIDSVQLYFPEQQTNHNQKQSEKTKFGEAVHLQIELDDGKVQAIFPKINDDPVQLATSFCLKHQLDEQMINILADNIRKTINKIKANHQKPLQTRFSTEPAEITKRTEYQNKKFISNSKQNEPTSRNSQQKPDLYERCIRQETSRKSWIQKQKIMKSSFQLIQCTHSPKINPISEKICNLKHNYKSKKKQNQYSSIRTESSVNTQPFDQKEVSKFQINKQNEFHSVFDYLYQDGKTKQVLKRQKMQQFLKRNCNFKPQINPISRKIVGNKSFQQRLNSNQRSSTKNSKNQSFIRSIQKPKIPANKVNYKIQKSTIQKKPLVNSSLLNLNKKSAYSSSKIVSSTKNIFKPISFSKQKSQELHNMQNQKLYQKQKYRAFGSIFSLLDDDNDGVISILKINLINGIEQKLIQVLFPVLQELQILQTELNLEEFCQAMNNLFKGLSVEEKGYLLKYYHRYNTQNNDKQNEQTSKKQKMTAVSMQLVNQTQRKHVSVYQYSKIREQIKQQKLQQQRIQKQRVLMRHCTFHPKVNPKKIIYF